MGQGEDGSGRYTRLVAEMAILHRRTDAYWQLLALGPVVVPVLHDGLSHSDAAVREGCVKLLDHFLTEETIPAIIAALDDEHPRVRLAAVHTLACDRCKKDACRPNDADVLPLAIRLVTSDPDKHVRAMAAELVGKAAHTALEAADALEAVRDGDPEPSVRKKAGWYAPGGTIYERSRAKTLASPALVAEDLHDGAQSGAPAE